MLTQFLVIVHIYTYKIIKKILILIILYYYDLIYKKKKFTKFTICLHLCIFYSI